MADEVVVADREETDKERKKREKKELKEAKKRGGFNAQVGDSGAMYLDAEDEEDEGSLSMALITFFIVVIWLAILGLLIKLDVGGFGSGILAPVLKNVPVINKVLPAKDVYVEEEKEFDNLNEAMEEIERLRAENEQLKTEVETVSAASDNSEEVAALKEEIKRLQTFENSQIEFQKLKTEFYEEVVFAEEAPDIANYRTYYESIDPENAEYLYKQVVQQMAEDEELSDYVKAYTEMKPKSAAKVFEEMSSNLDLVAKILGQMDASARAKILNVMDPEVASKLTKMMDPD
ncbi:MAG: hypothetical protein K6E98_01960 [Lachnospiraceae bacterium]|nr:hypothetical protein [Lachnospiraceae bacterium]